jgi:type VI secretion system secreted protein VgrG
MSKAPDTPTAPHDSVPTVGSTDDAPALKPRASFDISILYILKNEGGFVNDPADRGGATNFGITRATYQAFKGRKVSVDEIRHMPLSDAKAIYRKAYWSEYFEVLDQGVATAIFDWSVLHGTHGARELAQETANGLGAALKVDGEFGPATADAISKIDSSKFVDSYAEGIKAFFARLIARKPSQAKFKKGWNARADRIAALA